jgi:hypothetical protein
VNPEGELSTQDLAQRGGLRQGARSTVDPAAEQAARPPTRTDDRMDPASAGDRDPVMDRDVQEPTQRMDDPNAPVGATVRGMPPPEGGGRRPDDASGGVGEVTLLETADEDRFRQRWSDVQARFVDDPQEAVSSADGLVAELMQSLAQGFSQHKERLEAQWRSGGDPDTEELRQALQRYRSFFDRLLST